MYKKITSLFVILAMLVCVSSCSSGGAEFGFFRGAFSPFFAIQAEDISVVDATQETILVTSGDDAEIVYDAYTKGIGIADIDMQYENGGVACTIKLGEDVYFSDGVQMTADDIIFSMYVYADPSYEGWSSFCYSNIRGLANYHYGVPFAESTEFTDEQLDAALADPSAELAALVTEKVVLPVLEEELDWVIRSYDDEGYKGTEFEQYMKKYPQPKDLFAYIYSIDENYDSSAVDTIEQVFEDIKAQYGSDYKMLSKIMGVDLTASAYLCAKEILLHEMAIDANYRQIEKIDGIEKVDKFTVKVTFNSDDANDYEKVLGIYAAPLHYYGDESLYDYDNKMFGFVRGDLSAVKEKNLSPLGAGKYVFKSYKEDKGVSFTANKSYFRNSDILPSLYFKETGNSNADKTHGYYITRENVTYVEK